MALHVKTNSGVIVGPMGFSNQFDGHTLEPALDRGAELTGKQPKTILVDRGYRDKKQVGETTVLIPKESNKNKRYTPAIKQKKYAEKE